MQTDVLRRVHEGMKVVDASRKEIGRVDWVQYGNDDPETLDVEARSTEGMKEPLADTLVDNLVDAFRVDDLPEEIRQRLLMQGFVRIDAAGIFAADRYVLPEQIAGVADDELMLNVEKSELVMRHLLPGHDAAASPSPLVGEGARRADEGDSPHIRES